MITVRDFQHPGDEINVSEVCIDAVTGETRMGCAKFRESGLYFVLWFSSKP